MPASLMRVGALAKALGAAILAMQDETSRRPLEAALAIDLAERQFQIEVVAARSL